MVGGGPGGEEDAAQSVEIADQALDDLVNDLERFPLEPEDEGPEEEAPERAPEADAGDDGHGPPAGALDLNGDLDFEDEESDFGDDDLDLDLLLPDGSDTHTPVKAVSGTLVMSDESSDSELSAGGGGDPEEVDVSAAVDPEVNAVEVGGAEHEGVVVSGREGAGAEAAEAAGAGPPLDTEAEPAGAIDLSLDTESEPELELAPAAPEAEPAGARARSRDPEAVPEPRTEAATGLSLDTESEPELELAPALEPEAEPAGAIQLSLDTEAEPELELAPAREPEAEPAGAIQLSLDTESEPELELAPAPEPEAEPAGAIQLSLDTESVPEPWTEAATGLSQDTESEAELELSIAPAPEPDLAPEPEIRLDSVMDLAIDIEPEPAPEVETAAPPQPEPPPRVNEARPQPATPPRAGSGRIRLGAMLALNDEPAPASPASAAADEELRALRAQLREKEAALKEQVAQMQEVMLRRSLSPPTASPTASPVNRDGGGRSQTIIFALEQTVERLSLECKGHEARRKELQGQLAGAERERERLAEAARGAQGAWARSKQDLRAVKGREQALQGQVSSLGGTVGRLEAQLRREKERYSRLVHQVNASRRGPNAALERSTAALHELKGQADAEHGRTLLSVKHDPDTYSAYLRLALPTEDNREKAPRGEATTGVVTQAPKVAEADRAAPVGGAVAEDGAAAWGEEEEKEPGCLDGVAAAIRGALGGVGGGGAAKVGSVSPQKAPRRAVDDALRGE